MIFLHQLQHKFIGTSNVALYELGDAQPRPGLAPRPQVPVYMRVLAKWFSGESAWMGTHPYATRATIPADVWAEAVKIAADRERMRRTLNHGADSSVWYTIQHNTT